MSLMKKQQLMVRKTAIRKLSEIQELTKEMERFLKSAIKKIKIN
jgi:hypothetical protein